MSDNTISDNERYLEFSLGNEVYTIPLLLTKEVVSVPDTTPIPKAPPYFLGVMNLRGQVLSIIDIRKKLGITPTEDNQDEAVIIIERGDLSIGIVVDSINRVLNISGDDVQKMPELKAQINAKFIEGIYKKESGIVMLLDIFKCLDINDEKHLAA